AQHGPVVARRVPRARLGGEPLPRLCAPAGGGAEGHRGGVRAAAGGGGQRVVAHGFGAPCAGLRAAADQSGPGAGVHGGVRAGRRDARRADVRLRAAQQAQGVERVPLPGNALRAEEQPRDALIVRMSAKNRSSALSDLARLGFGRLAEASALLEELSAATGIDRDGILADAARAADPDGALGGILRILRRDPGAVRAVLGHEVSRRALWALLGASHGFADFFLRHPEELAVLAEAGAALPSADRLTAELLDAVGAADGFAERGDESARVALRVRYRRMLALIAVYDLLSDDPVEVQPFVSAALADAAGAAL